MDILTLYLVIFAQLEWNDPLIIVSWLINIVTVLPVVVRFLLPEFPQEVDVSGHKDAQGDESDEGEDVEEMAGKVMERIRPVCGQG